MKKLSYALCLFLTFLLSTPISYGSTNYNNAFTDISEALAVNVIRGPYLQMMTENSMTVRWRTDINSSSKVWYGTTLGVWLGNVYISGNRTNHEVEVTGLTPNTKYYYAIGDDNGIIEGNSADYHFYTAPTIGTVQPIRMWVLGDCGTGNSNARAVRDAYENYLGNDHTDMVLLLGDNAYNSGYDSEYQSAIFDTYTEHLRKASFFSCPGNHEFGNGSTDSGNETGPYYDIFTFPRNAEIGGVASGTEAYYSFDYGNVHIVSLDSHDSGREPGNPMLTWLENDLSATTQDWIIVIFHHPPYTKGSHDSDNDGDSGGRMTDMRENVLPILEDYGVDVILSGHSHAYERSKLIKEHYGYSGSYNPVTMEVDGGDGRVNGDGAYEKTTAGPTAGEGAVYVVTGSAGKVSGGSINHPVTYYAEKELGSTLIDVDDKELKLRFLRSTGAFVDSLTIIKSDESAPSVSIDNPTDGQLFTTLDPITIEASASDSDGTVDNVEFFVDGNSIGVDNSSPYSIIWTPPSFDSYSLVAKATDNDNLTTSSVPVDIDVNDGSTVSLNFKITAGNDDVEEEDDGVMYMNSSDIELVNDGSRGNQTIGLRFKNINIPQGSNIQNAYIQFSVDETSSGGTNLEIDIEDVDDAASFSTSAYNVSNRTVSGNEINWSPAAWNSIGDRGTAQQTPEIKTLIQHVVDRAGWGSGNDLAIIINGTGERTADSYEGSSSNAAELFIEYSTTPPLSLSFVTTDATCNGSSDGSVDLTVSGGTSPYTYNWSNGETTEDINSLTSGNYSVTVTDANSDTETGNVTINQPSSIVLGFNTTDVSCFGGNDGSIDLTVSGGGTSPYTYNWSNSETTEDIGGLSAGSYSVTVTDANGCTENQSTNLAEPSSITSSKVVSDVSCNGGSDGSIDLSVSGGTSPYSYNWSNGETTQDISGLSIGNYSVTITDNNGCNANNSATVSEPSSISSTPISTDASCNGGTDGSIDLSVNGGTSPYVFSWSNGETTEDISGLAAGTYEVTITDNNGCVKNDIATVSEPLAIAHNQTITDVSCNGGSDGSVDLSVSGGTSPYTFNWSNGETTEDISGLIAGTYDVTVTDANSCISSASYMVNQPLVLSSNVLATNISCNGYTDGSIDLTVSDGTSPYSYNWSNGETTEDINGLAVGTYDVTITDANGCISYNNAAITEPSQMSSNMVVIDVSCNGGNDGSIDLSVSGGDGPYGYSWSNGETTEDINMLTAGSYSVTITDANGCDLVDSDIVFQAPSITTSISETDISCNGLSDGSIDLTVNGGTLPYGFSWSNGESTEDISGLSAGIYDVTITDANGCTSNETASITEPTSMSSSLVSTNVSCSGGSDGSIDLSVSGGTSPYSYNWSNGETTEDLNGLSAGTYDVTITDANGCTTNESKNITEPSMINSSLVKTDVSCNGGSDGSIDLSVSGGTSPYSYNWSNGETTEDIGGLSAGSYSVTITDNNGCSSTNSAVITQAPALTSSVTTSDVSCNGGSDGSIDLSVSGGTSPYSYNWSNGETTEDINGLSSGSYDVTITDANGCTSSANAMVNEPVGMSSSTIVGNTSCNGGNDGSIDLSVNGGANPYSYSWSNGETTEDISGLTAGTYDVTITDANGCTISTNTTVSEPAAISSNALSTDVSCNGGSDGSIDLSVNGGTSPYSYNWSNGETTEDINGLSAGTYDVTITDTNGCTSNESANVMEPSILSSTMNATDVSCNGGSDGSIDLTVSGGTSPYSYNWSNGETTEDIEGLSAGSYSVTITDNNGCSSTNSTVITQAPALTSSVTTSDVSCNGGSDGSIDLSVSGGTSPYNYSWSSGETTEDISGLSAGTYDVTITDANGCTSYESASITEPTSMSSSLVSTDVSCSGGSDGSIDLSVSGGTSPYSYSWSNGETTEDISGLTAGTYNVTITDSNGCTTNESKYIAEPSMINSSLVKTDVSCNGGSDGSIDLSVNGGTSPYSYNWSNGETTEDISGLSTGSYSVTITDNNGCSSTNSAVITQAPALTSSVTISDVSCNGGSDGSIDLSVSGGTPSYSYNWSNGETTEDISGLTSGTYEVTITDANGCTASTNATVSEPAAISSNVLAIEVSCNGGSDGSIDLSVNGGTSPYSYNWSNGETTEDINGLSAGTYNVTITDAHGCTLNSSANISEPTALASSMNTSDVSCNGGSDGSIDLSVSGGTSPYSYSWSNGATTEDISGLVVGSYTVTITDNNGCISTNSGVITQAPALSTSIGATDVSCNSGSDGSIDLSVSGGTPSYSYNWSNGETTEDISGLTAGTYEVTITDANGCTEITNETVNEPAGMTSSTIVVDASCNGGSDGSIDLSVSGGAVPYSYNWSNGETTEDISGLIAGTYHVTITDANSCTHQTDAIVGESTTLSSNTVTTDVSCNSGSDGSIDLSVSGGNAPYSYSWSNGETTEDISGLVANTYHVTITDASACTSISSGNVSEPTLMTSGTVATDASCNGGSDGSIDLSTSGGTSPYSYSWSNGETTEDVSGLPAGIYDVTITDSNGCTATAGATVSEPTSISSSALAIDASCNGGSDGSIDLNVSGGTSPYGFSWSNSETTEDINGLSAGAYDVTITDANGCIATAGATVSEPTSISSTALVTDASCNGGSDGSIDISVSGGTSPYSFSWSNGESTEDISGLSAGAYEVTITDANGCSATASTNVTEPSSLTSSTGITDASCNGGSDGSIDLSVSGGTSPYSYSWSNGETTEDISGLSAGTYEVTITDANGCTATASTTVSEPSTLISSTVTTEVSCNGGSDGSIDISVSGGTSPYSFSWSNGESTEDINGLPAGTYNVTITDANGCTTTEGATVSEPLSMISSTVATDASCNGGSDGSIDLNVSGGTSPYNYSWSNGETTEDISGLSAGTYEVTITDANGCATTEGTTVSEPSSMTSSTTATDVSCNGGSDGSIDLSVNGGTSPYSYSWSNGETTEDISGLSAGTYDVTITDANGCTTAASATVDESTIIIASTNTTDVSCSGGSDGSIDLSVSGGMNPYSYSWSNGETTEDISGLTAGTYDVTITDANGCTSNTSASISEPTAMTSSANTTDVSCSGGSDGSIDLSVSGGTSPYSYSWSNGATTEDISGLTAGTYNVTITDANGCTSNLSASISEPTSITSSTSTTDVSCNGGSDGSIDLSVSGGSSPYTFSWSNGETTEDISGLIAGTYDVSITDQNGCVSIESEVIDESTELISSAIVTDASCNGGGSGAIDLSVTGGSIPYSYNWSNGATSQDISGLNPGSYTVTVTDDNGCVLIDTYNVSGGGGSSTSISVKVSSGNDDVEERQNDGYMYMNSSDLELVYDSYNSQNNQTVGIRFTSIDIPQGAVIENAYIQFTVDETDSGTTNLDIEIEDTDDAASFSTSAYNVSNRATTGDIIDWNPPAWNSVGQRGVDQQTPELKILVQSVVDRSGWNEGNDMVFIITGSGSRTAESYNGSSSNAAELIIEYSTSISLSMDITNSSCDNSNGSIDLIVSGGISPYSYNWSNGESSEDITGLDLGNYTVTVTDDNGCTESMTGFVDEESCDFLEASMLTNVSDTWQTVNTQNSYSSMIVVASVMMPSTEPTPVVSRIRNITANSFDIKLQSTNGSSIGNYNVQYTVVEEGAYNMADHGVKMEAYRYTSTITSENNSWKYESISYQNSYSNPVVLGQVMSYNDADWSAFWSSRVNSRNNIPTATSLSIGKHVGEDPDNTRSNETLGYIVIESGSGTASGLNYEAKVGNDIVRGVGNTNSGYTYSLSALSNIDNAVVSSSAMDGNNGGWPVLYGSNAISGNSLKLAYDEDVSKDSERKHTTEQVAYLAFGSLSQELIVTDNESQHEIDISIDNLQLELEAFPNPVKSELSIELKSESNKDIFIQLTDLNGNVIYHENLQVDENEDMLKVIDFRNHSNGMYMLRVGHLESNKSIHKIIVKQ